MAFMVNGYRLRSLTKDPAAVRDSVQQLAAVLAAAREHMTHIGRVDLADQLADLADRLRAVGDGIDAAFDRDFRAIVEPVASACREAAGPNGMNSPDDPNGRIYWDMAVAIIHVVIIRIGGIGEIEHSAAGLD